MKTAVIYARYSSDNQSEQSIEGQLHVCEDYAKNNDIILLDTYIDRTMTGTNDNRPAFQQMLKDSKKREWDYVSIGDLMLQQKDIGMAKKQRGLVSGLLPGSEFPKKNMKCLRKR